MRWKKIKSAVAGSEVSEGFHDDFEDWCEDIGGEPSIRDGKYEDELYCETPMGEVSIKKRPSAWVVETPAGQEGISGVPYWNRDDEEFSVRGNRPRNNSVRKIIEIDEDLSMETELSKKPDPRRHS